MLLTEMLPLHFRFKVQQLDEITRKPDFFILQSSKELLRLVDYLQEAGKYYLQNVLNKYEEILRKQLMH
ncbi:hypothetical protein ACFQU5_18265 [Ureibacillus sp. GCM10028918]